MIVDDGDEAIVDFDTFFDDLEVGLTIQVIDRDPVDRIADRARLEL